MIANMSHETYREFRGNSIGSISTEFSVGTDELSKEEGVQTAACDNGLCSHRGLLQKLKPTRVVLGALNPA
jgi:hypothetical protein